MKALCAAVVLVCASSAWPQDTAAKWIWYPEPASSDCIGQDRWFRKSIELVEKPASAILWLTVDDRQEVWANGRGPLERLPGEDMAARYDLSAMLKPGTNALGVKAHNVTGPAGLIARLVITGRDGTQAVISSDATWRVAKQEHAGWSEPEHDDGSWSPALIIGGAESRPWSEFPGYHTDDFITPEELQRLRQWQSTLLAPAAQFAGEKHARAELRPHNGAPALFINGEPRPLVMYRGTIDPMSERGRRQITNFRDAGVHLFCPYAMLAPCWQGPGEYDFSGIDRQLRAYLSADPEAYLILLVRLIPPEWWMKEHPDEWVAYGTSDKLDSSDESRRVRRASLASEEWLRDSGEAWRALIKHLEARPWGKRVVGYHACYGIYAEWHYFGSWTDQYPDTGAAMTHRFRQWLTDRYGTIERLRAAWADDTVTFAAAQVPGVQPRKTATLTTLRDASKEQRIIDYYRCQHQVVADDIEHFGKIAKDETGNRVVHGVYYGYFFGVRPQAQGGHLQLERLLKSPYVDYFVAPYSYSHRLMGQDGRLRSLAAAINHGGKAHILEGDIRTYLHTREEYGRTQNLTQTLAAVRREFSTAQIEHTGFWFVDFGPDSRGGWFDEPHIMDQAKGLQAMAVGAVATPRKSVAQIALVCDLQSGYYLSDGAGMGQVYKMIENMGTEMYHLGAPFDALLLSQLPEVDLAQYKMLVFLNTFRMTDEQARMVQGLRRAGKHAMVFLWAPGLCEADGPSVQRVRWVTGLDLELVDQWMPGVVHVTEPNHPLTRGLPTTAVTTITPQEETPVPGFGSVDNWYNPRSAEQMSKDYREYEVTAIEGGICWRFDTTYPWTDIHFRTPLPEGNGLDFEVKLRGPASGLTLQCVIKDADLAEFVTPERTIHPGGWATLRDALAAFTNAPWSRVKPDKPTLPLKGMKLVLRGTREAGPCALSARNLNALQGTLRVEQARSYGVEGFRPALIPTGQEGTVLGHLGDTGRPALVATGEGNATTVFAANPFIPREVLISILKRAGVHRYIDAPQDVLRADSSLICIHTEEGGDRTLRLPGEAVVWDAITAERIGEGTAVPLSLPPASTTILRLGLLDR